MYNFERRLKLTQKSYEDFKGDQTDNFYLVIEELEVFIMLARTITFVMQKELSKFSEFENWYSSKQKEMKEKYQYLVNIRNEIEKEGISPVKSGQVVIGFAPYTEAEEKMGTLTHPDGRTEDVMGKVTHTQYFDKEQKLEILSSSKEYLNYLEALVAEAVERFPIK